MKIRSITESDRQQWCVMRNSLWPGEHETHLDEIDRYLAGNSPNTAAVLVAEIESQIVGFVELSIRDHAEGCTTERVAYLEGWYVRHSFRKQGIGRALIEAAENWGREQGCIELGSDAFADNAISASAHAALGFEEVGIVRCFLKRI